MNAPAGSALVCSGLYVGRVMHRRWKPKRHRLAYRVFSLLVDLDELPALSQRLRWFSHNRYNLYSVWDRDFGAGDGSPLRPWIEAQLAAAGLPHRNIRIGLLCYPRILGYAFNPLSVFFCRRADGGLIAILYEVHNTFGQRHCYLIPADPGATVVRQACAKEFYVSPFIPMQARYRFEIVPPAEQVAISIRQSDAEGPLLDASFVGVRVALSDRRLLSLLMSHPLMTVKVIAGIHWEALKLWLKGVKLIARPAPPLQPVTIVVQDIERRGAGHEHERIFRPAA